MQLNRIQDQIDRVIVACGGVLPGTFADRKRFDFAVRCEPGRVIAIESAPAALALRFDSDTPWEDDSEGESLVSPEVAKLVQKYSV